MGKVKFIAGALCAFLYLATCSGGGGHGQLGRASTDAAADGPDVNGTDVNAGAVDLNSGSIDMNSAEAATGSAASMEIICDKASVSTLTIASGTVSTTNVTTTYYATISRPGLDPKSPPVVRVLFCQEDFENVVPPITGVTTTTTHSGDPAPETTASCSEGTARFGPGVIVVTCGTASAATTSSTTTTTTTSTSRYSKVYVSID